MSVPNELKEQLELAGKVVALAIPLSFVLSVGYDYGYLSAVGLSFETLPSTISDHLRTALVWMPITLLIALGVLGHVFVAALRRKNDESGATKDEKGLRRANRILAVAAALGFVAVAVSYVFGGEAPSISGYVLGALTVPATTNYITLHSRLSANLRSVAMAGALAVSAFLVVTTFGALSATYFNALGQPTRVQLKSEVRELAGRGVRYFERGVLLTNWPTREAVFIPWDQVEAIRAPSLYRTPRQGRLCNWFGWFCFGQAPDSQ